MTPDTLRVRTRQFAVSIIRFCRTLPRTDESWVIGRQLLRSGTSIGANYRAVCRARSDAEFVAKLGTTIEEADETAYWLEVLVEAEIVGAASVRTFLSEGDQLTRIFVASRETARRRMRARSALNQKSQIKDQK